MDIAVPPPPRSADLFMLGVWLLAGALPLVNAARQGWKKAARFSLMVLLGIAPLILPYLYVVRANAVEVAEGRLHVQAGYFYELFRSVDDFRLDEAVAAPLSEIPQARLGSRLVGIGAPGYSAGRFSMAAGGQAFVLLTDPQRTVFLPAKAGPSLIVSVQDPQGFLALLRSQRGAAAPP